MTSSTDPAPAVADGGAGSTAPEETVALEARPRPGGSSRVIGFVLEPTLAQTRLMARVVGPVFVVCAVVLVPWTGYLYTTLPSRQVSRNYDIAWAGFDIALAVFLVSTAWAVVRLSRGLPIAASGLGSLLLVDAWFDVTTSPGGGELVLAVAMAVLVELPLAAVSLWLAYHGQSLRERAIAVRLMRAVRLSRPAGRPLVRLRRRAGRR